MSSNDWCEACEPANGQCTVGCSPGFGYWEDGSLHVSMPFVTLPPCTCTSFATHVIAVGVVTKTGADDRYNWQGILTVFSTTGTAHSSAQPFLLPLITSMEGKISAHRLISKTAGSV